MSVDLKPIIAKGIKRNRYFVDREGNPFYKKQDGSMKLMGLFQNSAGYYYFRVTTLEGKPKNIPIARGVANAWKSMRLAGRGAHLIITHHNNKRLIDNCIDNIKTMTHKKHATIHLGKKIELLGPRGSKRRFDSITLAAEWLGKSNSGIQNVLRGTAKSIAGYRVRAI